MTLWHIKDFSNPYFRNLVRLRCKNNVSNYINTCSNRCAIPSPLGCCADDNGWLSARFSSRCSIGTSLSFPRPRLKGSEPFIVVPDRYCTSLLTSGNRTQTPPQQITRIKIQYMPNVSPIFKVVVIYSSINFKNQNLLHFGPHLPLGLRII